VFNNWYQTTFGDNENQDDYEDWGLLWQMD
jgi:hypothetical protein